MEFPRFRRRGAGRAVLALAGLALCGAVRAQGPQPSFPNRAITIVVPFVAGSPTDVIARALAADLGVALNNPVVVDNRPGASQTIAGSYVMRAPADGYTLLFANLPAVVAPSLQAKLPYAGMRDFTPVADVLTIGFMLVSAPGVPAANLKEFMALLKADPAKYSYGSSGISTPIHLMAEMFNKELGVKTLHVPYKGANQVQMDLMSDRLSYAFLPLGSMEYVRAGKLKAYGIASNARDPAWPELPTMEEAGLPNFKATVNFVLLGPKGLPAEVAGRLNAAANQVIANEGFYGKVRSVGGVEMSRPASLAQVGAHIVAEEARWDRLVKSADIQLE